MNHEIRTEILIHAPPERVWRALTAFDSYPEWDVFVKSITGRVAVGEELTIRFEIPGLPGMTLKTTVSAFEPNHELRWKGQFLLPGLFDAEHAFQLTDNQNGTTTFQQWEKYQGILVPLARKKLDKVSIPAFDHMNEKLRVVAETAV